MPVQQIRDGARGSKILENHLKESVIYTEPGENLENENCSAFSIAQEVDINGFLSKSRVELIALNSFFTEGKKIEKNRSDYDRLR